MEKITVQNECYCCKHKREVPGNCHIMCAKPSGTVKGHPHGISRGWFYYPFLFDPVWKTNFCSNHENHETKN
jgi:hypothetical protein